MTIWQNYCHNISIDADIRQLAAMRARIVDKISYPEKVQSKVL